MYVYLVQHGKAKSKDEDPERHLSEEGLTDVTNMSGFIKNLTLHVDIIWHSGKARAMQTAEILATGVTPNIKPFQKDGLAPKDDVEPVKQEIMTMQDDLMIVGHMPFMGKLASLLITGNESMNVVSFQPGGVVCLVKDNDHWMVRWIVTPDII